VLNFAAISQTVAEIWRFLFFNIATAAMLHFQNVEILGIRRVKWVKMRHRTKCRGGRSNRCRNMAIFIFQHGGRRHVGFSKCANLRGGKDQRVKMRHLAKFRGDRSSLC